MRVDAQAKKVILRIGNRRSLDQMRAPSSQMRIATQKKAWINRALVLDDLLTNSFPIGNLASGRPGCTGIVQFLV